MAKIYIYVIAVLFAAMIYQNEPGVAGIITALLTALIMGGSPFALDILREKSNRGGVFAVTLGLIAGSIAFGLVYPFLERMPAYIVWAIFGIALAGVSYVFYLFLPEGAMSVMPLKKAGEAQEGVEKSVKVKVLDTSIVIDGRIIDLASTGFIEGPLIVPNFVLREIQLISDSADPIKRNRGRRGLEMLNTLQKRDDLEVRISYIDYTETREVDAKLVRLAKDLDGKLITNDFNLNKVAELQDVEVLNINNLANALKPVVLPGEEMDVQVVKEGKDENQGIGYLDDGTMVVIENGGKLLGKKLKVNVTSVIQTNAGKMIFTKVASRN